MVFIASILGKSEAVLLDEPTSGIDPESRHLLWNLMRTVFESSGSSATSHRSCVLTTHSLEEAEALASRVAILVNGKTFAIGLKLEIIF